MKSIFTFFKIALVLLILATSGKIFAQAPHVILHNGTSATISPSGYTFSANDEVYWSETYNNGTTTTGPTEKAALVYNAANLSATSLTVTTADGPGLHTYTMRVKSGSTGCYSDASAPKTVFILPATTVAFNAPLDDSYCENVGSPSKTITATATPAIPLLPDGIGYKYTWSATKNAVAVSPLSSIGTLTAASGTTVRDMSSIFTMTSDSPGEYIFTVNVEYFKLSDNANIVKLGATPTSFATTLPKKITIHAKPTQPTITIL
jgi:hypothetical protein